MKPLILFTASLICFSAVVYSQQFPVIKATSTEVDIRDGLHFKKGVWHISPEKKSARYFVELPHREHRVTFYTDIDSASFITEYGGVYNFAIILNNKDTCYTQIVAAAEKVSNYKNTLRADSNAHMSDTIPFTIGKNNKIIIKGRVNNSDSVNLLFNLGAQYNTLSAASLKKTGLNIDNSKKVLDIAGLQWDSANIQIDDSNKSGNEDGEVGNSLFQDKVVEIDYDKRLIIIRESLTPEDTGFSRHEIIMNGVVPMVQAAIATKDTTFMGWFAFATGNSGNGWIDDSTATRYKLYRGSNTFFAFGDRVFVKFPELRIASLSFSNISAVLAKKGTHTNEVSLLGNSVLKRFNVILDNKNGYIYLKANSFRNTRFDNTFLIIYGAITIAVLLLITIIALIVRGISKRRKRRAQDEMDYATYDEPALQESN